MEKIILICILLSLTSCTFSIGQEVRERYIYNYITNTFEKERYIDYNSRSKICLQEINTPKPSIEVKRVDITYREIQPSNIQIQEQKEQSDRYKRTVEILREYSKEYFKYKP